jgi:hypothetical protein
MPYDLSIIGHMVEPELQVIETWAQNVPKNGVVVEIGSFFGRSAVCWAQSADPSVKIFCGDMFLDTFTTRDVTLTYPGAPAPATTYPQWEIFQDNIKSFKNVFPMRGWCPHGITYPGDPIDIFFLDAAHMNPSDWENITYFSQFLKPNSIICGHDYIPQFPDVVENVRRLEKKYNTKVKTYEQTSLWSIAVTGKLPSVPNKYTKTRAAKNEKDSNIR